MEHKNEQPTVDLTATAYPTLTALISGLVTGRISDWPRLKLEAKLALNEIALLQAENRKLRELLWVSHGRGYGDDGELQNAMADPAIDFARDRAEDIEAKLIHRNMRYNGTIGTDPITQDQVNDYLGAFGNPATPVQPIDFQHSIRSHNGH